MFPLHKAPIGLLELLRLRTLGGAPGGFEQAVRPVVDVSEFYAADTKIVSSGASTVGPITIPPSLNETLTLTAPVRLHSASAILSVAAAATDVTVEIGVRINNGTVNCPLGSIFASGLALGQRLVATTGPMRPIVVPGQSVFYAVAQGTGGGATCDLVISLLIDNITGAI